MELKKTLKTYDIFFIGLGYIVGAGIYSLLYLITKEAKGYTWISFLIGGIICILTALSYSDLNNHFNSAAADYDYITVGLTGNRFKLLVGLFVSAIEILMLITLCLAFSNILKKMYKSISYNLILFLVIAIPTLINIYNVKTTSNVNIGISILETGTLLLLIFLSFYKNPFKIKDIVAPKNQISKFSWNGIMHGAFISVFAYAGFETIPKLADDTIESRKNISRGMIYSLSAAIVIYILVSISVNNTLGSNNVGTIINPITETFNILLGKGSNNIINIITLFSIFNTILLTILFSSRQIYGIAKRDIIPKIFKNVNKTTNTPIYSILIVSIIALTICFFTNINVSAYLSNTILLILFILINMSSIILAYKGDMNVNGFNFSKNNNKKKGNISIYSCLGLITSIVVLIKSLENFF